MSTAAKKAPAKRASKDKTVPQAAPATSLVLRVCRPDMTGHGGFVWPSEVGSTVEAADWKNDSACGHGLHGWLYGQGDHGCVDHWAEEGAKWLVAEVETDSIVMLGGKCKFPRATVRFVGEKHDAATYLIAHEPRAVGVAVIGARIAVGDGGAATAGALSTLTGGDRATLTGGYRATLTGGHGATLTGGNRATLTGGDGATLTGGHGATLTGGNDATLTGGDRATLTGGNRATLTGGDDATLTGGDGATLTGGDGAELRIRYWDAKAYRWRTAIAYVGESGIKAGVAYRLNETHEFVEADQ